MVSIEWRACSACTYAGRNLNLASEYGLRELSGWKNSIWNDVDVHGVFAMVVDMAQMLVMENSWKKNFAYAVDLVVLKQLSHDLLCRQACQESRQF